MTTFWDQFETQLGRVFGEVDETGGLVRLSIAVAEGGTSTGAREREALARVRLQVNEYFDGSRKVFDLALAPEGTPFQQRVWNELSRIPFGATISYGNLAHRIGQPTAVRAVGRANGANPIWLVVPCHRVIGANGSLTGYAGGLPIKQKLLEWEGAIPASLSLDRSELFHPLACP